MRPLLSPGLDFELQLFLCTLAPPPPSCISTLWLGFADRHGIPSSCLTQRASVSHCAPPPINSHKSVVHAVASSPKPVAVFRSYTLIHCDTGSRPFAQSIVLPNRALEFRRPGSVEGRRSVVAAALVLSSLAASHMHDRCVKCACSCSGGLNPKSPSAAGVGIWSNLRFASAYRYSHRTDECRAHGWPEIGDLPPLVPRCSKQVAISPCARPAC